MWRSAAAWKGSQHTNTSTITITEILAARDSSLCRNSDALLMRCRSDDTICDDVDRVDGVLQEGGG